ncbi:MAG: YggS family pyridoxal phosphate-dependent enzyme [Clostridiales bacterium]|nr:YggS family pyridoxal phosphate-dependent enzyme [Candidatus Equinaster intestinalis]
MKEKSSIEIFDENYADILLRIKNAAEKSGRSAEDIILLAATKTVDTAVINHAIKSGIRFIGENRVQEFLSKENELDTAAHRHFIGHLQTNKVKDIVGRVELIHSVSSLKLAREIGKESVKRGIVTDCLLEVNIGNEESKSGFTESEIIEFAPEIEKIEGICVKGLMAIPPICTENEKNKQYFEKMYQLFIEIRAKKLYNDSVMLSMGMSDDFETAIECGSNCVRIGTALFGKRIYK